MQQTTLKMQQNVRMALKEQHLRREQHGTSGDGACLQAEGGDMASEVQQHSAAWRVGRQLSPYGALQYPSLGTSTGTVRVLQAVLRGVP